MRRDSWLHCKNGNRLAPKFFLLSFEKSTDGITSFLEEVHKQSFSLLVCNTLISGISKAAIKEEWTEKNVEIIPKSE